MMKLIQVTGIFYPLLLSSFALGAEYTIDKSHSGIGFQVRHMVVTKVNGKFKDFDGAFTFDPAKPETAKGTFTAKTASVDTGIEKRDQHLRSADFFEAEKHPTLTFLTKKMTAAGEKKYKLDGDLTIHGVTKPVSFDVDYAGSVKGPKGDTAGFTATAKINRKDFGLVWNKSLDGGGVVVSDEVLISIEVEATKK